MTTTLKGTGIQKYPVYWSVSLAFWLFVLHLLTQELVRHAEQGHLSFEVAIMCVVIFLSSVSYIGVICTYILLRSWVDMKERERQRAQYR